MKRIGIMSMQRVKNYGSFLQAFALKTILKDISQADVSFVDFETTHGVIDNVLESRDSIKKLGIKYYVMVIINWLFRKAVAWNIIHNRRIVDIVNLFSFYNLYIDRFTNEFWPTLGLSDSINLRPELDLLIIGSDEVFNYKEAFKAGYSNELFGHNANATRLISFSGSFGCTVAEDLVKLNAREKVGNYFLEFDAVSVRDMNSKKIVEEITDRAVTCKYHLDPVLHFDYSEYMPNLSHKKPYLAVYAYSGLSNEFKEAITAYARKNGLEILCFMGYQGSLGKFMNVSPFELLSYMKDAQCVVTTTFHGSVFSLKYNKSFCAIVQHRTGDGYGNDEKMGDLLNRVNLSDHMIDLPELVEKTLDSNIEYVSVNKYIEDTVEDAISFLKEQVDLC